MKCLREHLASWVFGGKITHIGVVHIRSILRINVIETDSMEARE